MAETWLASQYFAWQLLYKMAVGKFARERVLYFAA